MCVKHFAFSNASKIKDKKGYSAVFAKPCHVKRSPFFSTFVSRSNNDQARLGLVVAKRYVRLAVDRNRIKRLIRESFRQQQEKLSGLDFVVVVKKGFSKTTENFFQ